MSEQERLTLLYEYASGHAGTRSTMDKLGLSNYAELLIELSSHDLPLPKPDDTPVLKAHRDKAREILEPRLRHGH